MRVNRLLSVLTVLLALAVPVDASPTGRVVTVDDIAAMRTVGDAVISPDGAWVLFTVRSWEPASGSEPDRMEARTRIWRVSAVDPSGAGEPRQMTRGERGESSPGWSPDGRTISFLAARGSGEEAKPQVWVMSASGGEAVRVTNAPEGVTGYAWSPDSRSLAYVSVDPHSEEEAARRTRRDDPRVFEADFRYAHIWVVEATSREISRVTGGTDFSVRGVPSWSSDGARLVFSAAPTPMQRDYRSDVYIATVSDGALERVTDRPAPDTAPSWSPDGRTVAFLSQPGGELGLDGLPMADVGQARLALYEVAARRSRTAVSDAFDLAAGSPIWAADSSRIYFLTGRRVYRELYAYDLEADRFVQLTRDRHLGSLSISTSGERAAFTMDSPADPADVYVASLSGVEPERLTRMNPQVADLALGGTDVITWTSHDGLEVEGLLLKPVGYEVGRRYPLLVVVHGGPTSAFTNGFRVAYSDGGQHWAGEGWAVLYPNPRGSTQYGERFMRANIPDWGGGDYHDIMSGVDALIERGIADSDRLAVMGWSYGGYMTAWIVTQTGRFKAAMVGAGLTNLYSMYGTNDIPNYLAAFFGGIVSAGTLPFYLERSALTHVDRVTTPVLILHGADDERVPAGQALEFFRALKDRGRTVELILYPRQGHGLSEYYHQRDRLRRQHDWITRHTLGAGAGIKTDP